MFTASKPTELWRQLPDEPDLWHGEHGVILNSAALLEREFYFDIVRGSSLPTLRKSETSHLGVRLS